MRMPEKLATETGGSFEGCGHGALGHGRRLWPLVVPWYASGPQPTCCCSTAAIRD